MFTSIAPTAHLQYSGKLRGPCVFLVIVLFLEMPKSFKSRSKGRNVNLKKRRSKTRPGKVFAKKVQQVIQQTSEHKFIDTDFGSSGITGATTVMLVMPSPTQGVQNGQRVGEKIRIRSLNNRFLLDSSTDAYNKWRITFVQWRGSAVAPPAAADIYSSLTSIFTSPFNRQNLIDGEFKVMYDKVFVTSQVAGPTALERTVNFFGKRIPHPVIEYDGTSTTADWKIYVLVSGDSIGVPNPGFIMQNRFSYTDV